MNVMLDLETLSTRSNATILVIAAIKFKNNVNIPEEMSEENLSKMDTFYKRITFDINNKKTKYHIDKNTLEWWNKQSDEVCYEALKHPDRISLKDALQQFADWIQNEGTDVKIYGNGSSFDVTIITEAFAIEEIPIPWKFWMVRDLRTVMDLGNVRMSSLPIEKQHHALYDCYRQIIGYQRSMKNIKK
jgi:hypothetical protein